MQGEGTDDFVTAQLELISEYRRLLPMRPSGPDRAGTGRRSTRRRRPGYPDALSHVRGLPPRTHLTPQGERRILFAPDLVGTAQEIIERLHADRAVAEVSELRLELPYEFDEHDYEQILRDVRTLIAPKLGWQPTRGQYAINPHRGS